MAALESEDDIREMISDADMVFITCGMGGGTGTGAASVVIEAAQSQGITTFAVAISPFSFEGSRKEIAKIGYSHIKSVCRNSILVENDLVCERMPDLNINRAFAEVNRSIMKHVMECVKIVENTFVEEMMKPKTQEEMKAIEDAFPIGMLIST